MERKDPRGISDILQRPNLEVARSLLGMKIVTRINRKSTSGMIVEVEAYDGRYDQPCHCF